MAHLPICADFVMSAFVSLMLVSGVSVLYYKSMRIKCRSLSYSQNISGITCIHILILGLGKSEGIDYFFNVRIKGFMLSVICFLMYVYYRKNPKDSDTLSNCKI